MVGAASLPVACGDDNAGSAQQSGPAESPEQVGQSCTAASQCFTGVVEGGAVAGQVKCLDRVEGGYCTHTCDTDADCCAVEGECLTDFPQVCAPFESTGMKYCFLSCEDSDIAAHETELVNDAGQVDPNEFCAVRAHADFICRSTGGGRNNRKVCVPGGTAPDAG